MKKFTVQEVIDMGADLFDNYEFSKTGIEYWLREIVRRDLCEEEFDFNKIFELIAG